MAQEAGAERRDAEPRPQTEPRPSRERSASTGKPDEEPTGRRGGKRRRAPKDNDAVGTVRYFLTKTTSNGVPELDEELPDEHQALMAAFKGNRNFVTVEEWKPKGEKRKRATVIEKEPVPRQ